MRVSKRLLVDKKITQDLTIGNLALPSFLLANLAPDLLKVLSLHFYSRFALIACTVR